MALLVVLLLLTMAAIAAMVWHWWQNERAERIRDRARLTVVEGQLATFRALLRIGQAEHQARQKMKAERYYGSDEPQRWSR